MGVTKSLRVVVVGALLFGAACGARLDSEQVAALGNRARVATRTAPGAQTGAPTQTTVAVGPGAGGAAPVAGGQVAAGASDAAGPPQDAGGSCTPSGGALDAGIDDTSVTTGSVATVGGPVPGLFTNVQNGVKAYYAYINATQGGVCGRKLNVLTADDRLDAGQNRAETEALIPRAFAFVGSYSVVDDGGASVLSGKGIPDIGSAIGSSRASMPESFPTTPNDPSRQHNGSQRQWQYFREAFGVNTVQIVWPAQGDARTSGKAYVNDIQDAGLTTFDPIEVAITETNYTGVATKIKDEKADAVITVLEINGIARLAQALQQVGYQPKVRFYGAQTYGKQLIKLAGPAAEGTILAVTHSIVEDAATSPTAAAFAEWYQRVNPGADTDFFAIQGWLAGAMFVKALQQAGAQPTRAKVMEQLRTFTAFDADGFNAPINPAEHKPTQCFAVITVEGGTWKRLDPAGAGFRC
jgi:ABC-type branched-subunit amino acid transport system substrate-binding protein